MIRPWKRQAAAQEAEIAEAEQRIRRHESNWDVIYEEVVKGRQHRDRNHIMDLIIGVARGSTQ